MSHDYDERCECEDGYMCRVCTERAERERTDRLNAEDDDYA